MIGHNVSLFVFLLLISFLNFGFLMNIKETNPKFPFLAYPSALNTNSQLDDCYEHCNNRKLLIIFKKKRDHFAVLTGWLVYLME